MLDIAGNKTYQLSSQIRFALLDVIELRRNHWVDNPKTIGEVIIEMEKEEHEQKIQALIAMRKLNDDYGNAGRDSEQNREYFILIAILHDYLDCMVKRYTKYFKMILSLIVSLNVRMLNARCS